MCNSLGDDFIVEIPHLFCREPRHAEAMALEFGDELDELGQPALQLIDDALPCQCSDGDIDLVVVGEDVEGGVYPAI